MSFDSFVPVEWRRFYQRQGPLGRTICEALALMFFNLAISVLLIALNLHFLLASDANKQALEQVRGANPMLLLLMGILLAPLLEEAIFRGLPSLLLREISRWRRTRYKAHEQLYWMLGGTAAILFSLSHGVGSASPHFPLPQFLAGLWFWQVANVRGLRYSILQHAVYNGVPISLMLLSGNAT